MRQGSANHDRTTGNLILAAYRHDASRELDPQLHTHAVAANLTYDGTEARWKALQASEIYEHRAYLTEIYRNALAREVEQLGYQVENRREPLRVPTTAHLQGQFSYRAIGVHLALTVES